MEAGTVRAESEGTPGIPSSLAPVPDELHRWELFSSLFDEAPVGMVLVGQDRRILEVNRAFSSLLGYAPDELTGRAFEEIAEPQEPGDDLFGGKTRGATLERRLRTKAGAVRWVDLTAGVLRDARGNEACGIAIVVDATSRRKAWEALQRAKGAAEAASRSKSEFLASMSHEVRTPMASILGYADLLLDAAELDPEHRSWLEIIRQNGKHLLGLLNEVLDLSKAEAGKLTMQRAPCSPIEIVREVLVLLEARAREKGIELRCEQGIETPGLILSDPMRLRQILINLVGNAIKFTKVGTVRVFATPLDLPGRKPLAVFEVVDTGVGLTREQLGRLFQEFSQAESTTTHAFGGSGLGLLIARRIANLLGGDIAVQSFPGRGSSVMVWVEADKTEAPAEHSESGIGAAGGGLPSLSRRRMAAELQISGRVLIADDFVFNRQLFATFLECGGAQVECVADGRAAVERALASLAEGQPFDLVVLDLQMPVLDGTGAAMELRRRGFSGPLVALTASVKPADRERCLASGFNDFLYKPVDRRGLVEMAARYLPVTAAATEPSGGDGPEAVPPELTDLVPAFLDWLRGEIDTLERLRDELDIDLALRTAHSLKGCAGTCGFSRIAKEAARLEAALRPAEDETSAVDQPSPQVRLAELIAACRQVLEERAAAGNSELAQSGGRA
jgi:PAS domain S-box-containing protein